MKKFVLLLSVLATVFTSCEDEKVILTTSSGNINNLSVIVENDLWKGEVGDAIRTNLAATVEGLPQEEPLFNMNQIPPKAFSGFVTKKQNLPKS